MDLPAGSKEWSHCAEWNEVPANDSTPSMWGRVGRESWPTALTRMSTVSSRSSANVTVQVEEALFHVAATTSWPKRTSGVMACLSATERMYAWISSCNA